MAFACPMPDPTNACSDRRTPGPLALGCLVLAFLAGRAILHLQWVKETDAAANFESGLVMGYPVVLGVWAALAPHALGLRMMAAAVVGGGLLLSLGRESTLPTAVLMLGIVGLVGVVLRASDLRLACGEHQPAARPLRLSLRQLLLATTLVAIGCGWAAGVAGDQFEELAEEWPIMAFSLVYLSVTLSPAVFASLLLAGPVAAGRGECGLLAAAVWPAGRARGGAVALCRRLRGLVVLSVLGVGR